MEINNNIQLYWSDICQISYEGYKKELSLFHDIMPLKSFEEFTRFVNESKEGIKGLVYLEEGKCTAFLLYNVWEDHGGRYIVLFRSGDMAQLVRIGKRQFVAYFRR